MARPPIKRLVAGVPRVALCKPAGAPARELQQSRLGVDELEAMRLVDGEGLSHEQAAEQMGVSRQTVGRVLEVGRKKVVAALTEGQAIVIDGGQYRVGPQRWRCRNCNAVFEAEYRSDETPPCPVCGSVSVGLCLGYGDGCGKGGRWRRGADAAGPVGPGDGGRSRPSWSAERSGGRAWSRCWRSGTQRWPRRRPRTRWRPGWSLSGRARRGSWPLPSRMT